MQVAPDFSSRHTLDVEHRKRVEALRAVADPATASSQAERYDAAALVDPDITVRLAARLCPADVAARSIDDELSYVINAGPVLMKYYDLQEDDSAKPAGVSKDSILRFFVPEVADENPDEGRKAQLMKDYERATRHVADPETDADAVCKCCGSRDLVLVTAEACKICRVCDACEPVVVETDRPPSKDTVKDSTAFCYKRSVHCSELLSQVQGKQQANIPDEVFDVVLLELKKRGVVNLASLTPALVRSILKKYKLNKYYEVSYAISRKLSGKAGITIPLEVENEFRMLFASCQGPFVKHAPPFRTNFLSYSYVLHKFSELLGHDELLPLFPLLKSREKLAATALVWRAICKDLNWELIPSL